MNIVVPKGTLPIVKESFYRYFVPTELKQNITISSANAIGVSIG